MKDVCKFLRIILLFCIVPLSGFGQENSGTIQKLDNPITEAYLKRKLSKKSPKLIFTTQAERLLRKKLETDPVVKNVYQAIQLNATKILEKPLIERKQIGRRILSTSREMIYRMNILGMVYRIEKDKEILDRINQEINAACNFKDWNPTHFLDVGEMALGVALAVDWVGNYLPASTVQLAKKSLIEKGLNVSINGEDYNWWISINHNWNQVCHGGMVAAAIVTADINPQLSTKVIHRALEKMPLALHEYGPDGVYPEGATYWGYGTSYSILASDMFQTAFNTDFGIYEYPAFIESAMFKKVSASPIDLFYNFSDCGTKLSKNGSFNLAWFAKKTGQSIFYEKERFLIPVEDMGKLSRFAGAGLVWLAQYKEKVQIEMPTAWKGDGRNPVVIFQGNNGNKDMFYFGAKGGKATINHANMDGGSFVFELDGVRWVLDPGNQGYHDLEKEGFDLWHNCQDCQRWTLLTKNNFGHSTISINGELFYNDGNVPLIDYKDSEKPEASFDMSASYGGKIGSVTRRFVKESNRKLRIEDAIETNDSTEFIVWQLITDADVELNKGGALLKKDGKELEINNISHPDLFPSLISLDPPPIKFDKRIEGLKRIEFRYPAYLFETGQGVIQIELSGE